MQKIRQDARDSIGSYLRALRLAAGLSQEQVAAKLQLMGCDVSRSVYSQMERGTYNLRVRELAALKRLFHVDYNALFEGVDEGLEE